MKKQLELEIKVGMFVSIGLGLIMLGILVLGSTENMFSKQNHYSTYFPNVEGLIPGAKVVLSGVAVGTVSDIVFEGEKKGVRVEFSVSRKYVDWVKKDSFAEIATQGMLGDKLINLTAGTAESAGLPNLSDVQSHTGRDLTQFLSKGDQLMTTLTSMAGTLDHMLKTFDAGNRSEIFFQGLATSAKNMSLATERLNAQLEGNHLKNALKGLDGVMSKINNGTGTLGALINDPGLYDDAKALLGGANRNRIIRNLVRQTVRKNEEAEGAQSGTGPKK